ncbi:MULTISPECIES: tRNA-uridine aminocarboxypropyltransferase [Nitrospirillum]|uniref:tRNA-uridine aminocarboxypropyltransferase n=1 Tax=Nitrospirillum amazonense TaxID=28077 RepID=A0A560FIZ9_9PROT|nr:tRNA-uridine aminocarboxypropyltransferase [Nitrospirillum amazonense]MEC4594180.1 tRNA-uridine aminocarboxypropyltransferase [Nitrospirillum amazonense]TWB21579.1 DTW domain-containing protein YfiP [Nitrospirillum amazonense]
MTDDTVPPAEDATPQPPTAPVAACPRCAKPLDLCVCEGITPIETRLEVLVLQHPQEQDVELGSARLLTLGLARGRLKVGLSWPNLAKALGREGDPRRWAVLYMGSGDDAVATQPGTVRLVDKKGQTVEDPTVLADLEGIILLDGSWSQAKALWWRNAWLLKLRRLIVHPDFVSAYGNLRREPRRESVSTLEAGAFALAKLEGDDTLVERLRAPFIALVARYRAVRGNRPPKAAANRPSGEGSRKPDWRGRKRRPR